MNNNKKRKVRSARRITIEKNIELFLLWGSSAAWIALFLLLMTVYFKTGVTQNEIRSAIRYQLVSVFVAIFMCPLVQFPMWVRTIVFGLGLWVLEVGI